MSSPIRRSRATSSPSSPTLARSTGRRCRRWHSRSDSRRRPSCFRRSRAGRCGSASSRRSPSFRSPGIRASGRRGCSHRHSSGDSSSWKRRGGIVPVEIERDESGAIVFGRMDQPLPSVEPYPDPETLLRALGVGRSQLPIERYDNGLRHTFVNLGSSDDVAALHPDFAALAELEIMVSCFTGSGSAWKTRMFAPSDGVPEDPATGSAAGPLAVHVCRHGLVEWGVDRDLAGRRDRKAVDALRSGRRSRRRARASRRWRPRRRGRAR